MRNTKKITLSAILVALGVVILYLGTVIQVADLTLCAIASLFVVFVYLEIGSPYTWLVWICTALITCIFSFASLVWLEYFAVFGIYPILKAYFEKLPRWLWLIIKLAYINAVIWLMFFFVELVFDKSIFTQETFWLKAAFYVLVNVAFIAYDMFITVAVRIYYAKIRKRFASLLK